MNLYKDIIERAVWTAAQAFLAIFTVADMSSAKTAGVAAMAAAISAVKSIVASKVGEPTNASMVS